MSIVADSQPPVSRLSATDPNLAFLASRAAIELDRIRQGKSIGTTAVAELGNLLKNSTQNVPGTEEPAALWDPRTISLIHSAINAKGSTVATLDQLLRQALDIAQELESTKDSTRDAGAIERLCSFCIGLANSAVAQERSQIELTLDKNEWS